MKKTADVMSKIGKWLLVFSFIFSVVSFPLEVLADELMNDEFSYQNTITNDDTNTLDQDDDILQLEPVIKINGEVRTEYTIEENTEVTIVLEYQEETKTEVLDFSNKLYGIYQYTFNSLEEVVTINYIGNNADLLKQYETVNNLTKKISCNEEECVISGFGSELVTVADIRAYYNLEEFEPTYNALLAVTNTETDLLDTDTILNGHQLKIADTNTEITLENGVLINTTPTSTYTINRVGDVFIPSDGLIDTKDQEAILDDILQENDVTSMNDINGDNLLNILDATHSTYMDTQLPEGEVTDILTNTLTSTTNNLLIDETIEVKLLVSGFDKLSLYGIEGLLTYDKNILELVGAILYQETEEEENLGYLNLENGKFAYVLANGFNNNEEALLTLKFKALSAGESEITINNILESYGEAFAVENDTTTLTVTVLENGVGGNPEDDKEETPTPPTNKEETEEPKEEIKTEVVVKPVVLSSDYYIKNLTIEGYDIDFNMHTYDYTVKVGSDVTSLDFKVLLNDNNSIYYVEGNENFTTGENLVYLVVKAQNGSTKTYTIRVEKEKKEEVKQDNSTKLEEEDIEEEEKNTSKTIIIILIILVIIGLIYVIFKDDEEEKEVKKTSQPEKVKSEEIKVRQVKNDKPSEVKKKPSNSSKNTKKGSKK